MENIKVEFWEGNTKTDSMECSESDLAALLFKCRQTAANMLKHTPTYCAVYALHDEYKDVYRIATPPMLMREGELKKQMRIPMKIYLVKNSKDK